MDLVTLLIVILVFIVLLGGAGWHQGWYGPGPAVPGILGVLLLVVLIVLLLRVFGRF